MESSEISLALLKNDLGRYIEEGKEERKRQGKKMDDILKQVKYTNGRVSKLEERELIKKTQIGVLKWLAGLGFFGGLTPIAIKILSIYL